MMWYPAKAAFRAGQVSGTHWNKENIGLYSLATGFNTKASGYASTAMGQNTTANGFASTAMGDNTTASGFRSTAMGDNTTASGEASTAMGGFTNASGTYSTVMGDFTTASGSASTAMGGFTKASGTSSTAMGFSTKAKPYASLVIGQYNDTTFINSFAWDPLDPVFIIGNGSANSARSNALTVLKNGKTGINTHDPKAMLHIIKTGTSGGLFHSNATAILESNQNAYLQFSQTNNTESGFLSGNNLTTIRSALIFGADSTIMLRTGGNNTRMMINKAGNVGIGTTSPQRLLHVSGGPSGAAPSSSADIIFEDDEDVVINLLTPADEASGIFFGNPLNGAHGGIVYNSNVTNGLDFRTNGNTTKAVLDGTGNFGIGTTSPQRLLHVSGGPSGATPSTSADVILEDNEDVLINLLTPAANASGIFFGNPANAAHGGIVYNSAVANGLDFRTNGNTTKAVINDIGNMGIGDNSPNARMHISNGAGGGMYFGGAEVIVEDNDPSYIQFSTTTANEAGILSGNASSSIRSGLIFRPDSSVQIRTGGNTTRVTVVNNGNVGIGTSSPSFKLHLSTDSAAKPTTSAWTVSSDARLKKDVHDYKGGLQELLKIHPVWFT